MSDAWPSCRPSTPPHPVWTARWDTAVHQGHPDWYTFCFTSIEAKWLVRGRGGGGVERKSEEPTADTVRKRPERPWTAPRTMEVLRRCSLAVAQRLVHCAIAVPTAVLGQSHKDNVRCTAAEEQLEAKEVQLSQPSSTHDLFWANLKVQLHSTSLLLIF